MADPISSTDAMRQMTQQLSAAAPAAGATTPSSVAVSAPLDTMQAFESARRELELQRLRAEAELSATEQHDIIAMRGRWSQVILWTIVGINVLDALVVILAGTGVLRYDEGLTVPLFVADSLLKTLGLAAIIVAFLFNKSSVMGGKDQAS